MNRQGHDRVVWLERNDVGRCRLNGDDLSINYENKPPVSNFHELTVFFKSHPTRRAVLGIIWPI